MKYPTLNIAYKVEMHKAFSKPIVLHFDGEYDRDDNLLHEYCKHILKLATIRLADNFIISQAVAVDNSEGYYVLCKDNLDIAMMKGYVAAIMEELERCGENLIHFTFGYAKTMLMVDGCKIGMFASNQVGEDFLKSEEYRKSMKEEYPKKRIYVGHFLPSFEEFKKETTNLSTI